MSRSPYEDKYLGEKRIKLSQPAGETRNGSPLVKIVFNDNTSAICAQKMLDSEDVLTNHPSDATKLRGARAFAVTKEILKIFLAYNIEVGEVDFLNRLVATSVNRNLDVAEGFQWSVPYLNQRTMDQVDRVLEEGEKADKARPKTLDDILGKPGA